MSRRLFGGAAALIALVACVDALRAAPVVERANATTAGDSGKRAPMVRTASATKDSTIVTSADHPVVMREIYAYEGIGRRDPFYPLILTNELRPMVGDLVLTSILFDPSGRRSVAVMRDRAGAIQYRVTTGMLLGRMRVTDIRPRAVFFSVQEFGANRRDSLVLVDTTKVRSR